jgi:hypothetical protein
MPLKALYCPNSAISAVLALFTFPHFSNIGYLTPFSSLFLPNFQPKSSLTFQPKHQQKFLDLCLIFFKNICKIFPTNLFSIYSFPTNFFSLNFSKFIVSTIVPTGTVPHRTSKTPQTLEFGLLNRFIVLRLS